MKDLRKPGIKINIEMESVAVQKASHRFFFFFLLYIVPCKYYLQVNPVPQLT